MGNTNSVQVQVQTPTVSIRNICPNTGIHYALTPSDNSGLLQGDVASGLAVNVPVKGNGVTYNYVVTSNTDQSQLGSSGTVVYSPGNNTTLLVDCNSVNSSVVPVPALQPSNSNGWLWWIILIIIVLLVIGWLLSRAKGKGLPGMAGVPGVAPVYSP